MRNLLRKSGSADRTAGWRMIGQGPVRAVPANTGVVSGSHVVAGVGLYPIEVLVATVPFL